MCSSYSEKFSNCTARSYVSPELRAPLSLLLGLGESFGEALSKPNVIRPFHSVAGDQEQTLAVQQVKLKRDGKLKVSRRRAWMTSTELNSAERGPQEGIHATRPTWSLGIPAGKSVKVSSRVSADLLSYTTSPAIPTPS
jgi:hypothetical protein